MLTVSATTRHTGNVAVFRFAAYAARGGIKVQLLQLASTGLRSTTSTQCEAPYVLRKLAAVFSQLAVREWPQRWSVTSYSAAIIQYSNHAA